jgi:hypothetical protein
MISSKRAPFYIFSFYILMVSFSSADAFPIKEKTVMRFSAGASGCTIGTLYYMHFIEHAIFPHKQALVASSLIGGATAAVVEAAWKNEPKYIPGAVGVFVVAGITKIILNTIRYGIFL